MRSTNTHIVVRPIREGDLDALLAVLSRAFAREIEIRGFDLNRFQRNARLYRLSRFLMPILDFFHKDYPTILVATVADKVVGEVHLAPTGNRIWTIDSLATDPAHTGQGAGFNLIKGSVEYIMKKNGKRAISSIRTDNIAALKIAEKLGFSRFQKRTIFYSELNTLSATKIPAYISVRRLRQSDSTQVLRICETVDPSRTQSYCMTSESFKESLLEQLVNRVLQVGLKRLVIQEGKSIVGYANLTCTSKNEAARINSFYILSSSELPLLATALLDYVFRFLAQRGISRIAMSLHEYQVDTIEAIERLGFSPIASFHEIVRETN